MSTVDLCVLPMPEARAALLRFLGLDNQDLDVKVDVVKVDSSRGHRALASDSSLDSVDLCALPMPDARAALLRFLCIES